ncbi:hypothetical protein FNH05_28525, partial [Amycolatopsis rhizosphaerae]
MKKLALTVGGLALTVALTACGAKAGDGTGNTAAGTNATGGMSALFSNAQDLAHAASSKTGQAKTAKFTMDMSMGKQSMKAQGSGDFAKPAVQMTMNIGEMTEEMRIVDNTVYIKLPKELSAKTGSSKPWVKTSADSMMGKQLGAGKADQNDPSKMLEKVQQAGTITKSEQTVLDGQPATHYAITVDLNKAMQVMGSEVDKTVLDKIAGKNITFPMEIWLNSDMLPVQITEDLSDMMKAAGAPAGTDQVKM